MALDSPTLKAGIIAKIEAKIDAGHLSGSSGGDLDKFAEAVAEAVVEHLTAAAVTTVGTMHVTTTCPAGAGTGVIVGTGTLT